MMPADAPPRPATPAEVEETLAVALRINGRKRFDAAIPMMAKITAKHLRHCLDQSGLVVMKKPPTPAYRAPDPHYPKAPE